MCQFGLCYLSYLVNYIKACTNFNGQVINLTKSSKSTFTFAHFVYTVMAELLKNNFFSSNVYIRFHKQKERQLDGYSSVLVSLHRCGGCSYVFCWWDVPGNHSNCDLYTIHDRKNR